ITIVQPSAEAPSTLVDSLEFAPFIAPGSMEFTFIPRWAGLFDSFAAPDLPPAVLPVCPDRDFSPRTVFKDWALAVYYRTCERCVLLLNSIKEKAGSVLAHFHRDPEPDPEPERSQMTFEEFFTQSPYDDEP
ncbi:MAG: hypothetical protein IJ347_06865, partial [Faecalibacterium sp.]|nr:hypothetical protein [Faecalibacterium sp.]